MTNQEKLTFGQYLYKFFQAINNFFKRLFNVKPTPDIKNPAIGLMVAPKIKDSRNALGKVSGEFTVKKIPSRALKAAPLNIRTPNISIKKI